ncbi:hypothetical protein IFM89_027161 [Coptis chinensis]|uniref:Armadillo-like repeats domain-containing protein n=1 Tax=Coptis chinensis TaxID=261450 RepID=A0A835HFP7_9MAGN|nr:hypothetical protein IFM89_027161 [Coptis chinensis]
MLADLIQLREKVLSLNDARVAKILSEISRQLWDKGPVVMDIRDTREKGFKRKLAVARHSLGRYFIYHLPEFYSRESSLIIKEIFGVLRRGSRLLFCCFSRMMCPMVRVMA